MRCLVKCGEKGLIQLPRNWPRLRVREKKGEAPEGHDVAADQRGAQNHDDASSERVGGLLLIPHHREEAKLQGERADGHVQHHIRMEADDAVQDHIGVDGNNSAEGRADDKVADLEQAHQQDSHDDAHDAGRANADPEGLLLATRHTARKRKTPSIRSASPWQAQTSECLRQADRKRTC